MIATDTPPVMTDPDIMITETITLTLYLILTSVLTELVACRLLV